MRFVKVEDGTATDEFVVWIPFFLLLLAGIADASLLFNTHARMYDVARTASRQVALGLASEDQAKTTALARFGDQGFGVDIGTEAGIVTTTVSVPFSVPLVFAGTFTGDRVLNASVSMVMEGTSGGASATVAATTATPAATAAR